MPSHEANAAATDQCGPGDRFDGLERRIGVCVCNILCARDRNAGIKRRGEPNFCGISKDEKSGQNFYTVRIRVPDDELPRLDKVKLVPGMIDAYIQTTSRTMMSYLLRPVAISSGEHSETSDRS